MGELERLLTKPSDLPEQTLASGLPSVGVIRLGERPQFRKRGLPIGIAGGDTGTIVIRTPAQDVPRQTCRTEHVVAFAGIGRRYDAGHRIDLSCTVFKLS